MIAADSSVDIPLGGTRSWRRSFALVALAAVAITACGSSDSTEAPDPQPTEPVEVTTEPQADADTPTTEADTDADEVVLQENGPVVVDGSALVDFDSEAAPGADDPAVGEQSPVVSGESFDGTAVTFGGPSDNATLVVFVAHWCPHCNDEIPELLALEADGRFPENLGVIGVSAAVRPGEANYPPSQWATDKGWEWPMMADSETNDAIIAFGGTSFPFIALVDVDGTVLARRAGGAPADETLAFIEDALATAG